eukprot:gnl/TRDRNA2_/TRDRNA2_48545_c0_seq1.p1 gnl/TRDRNA2_/TRDRNA2_48545_c0~~gnl/TRDRNA2_/TRDRNA2_48545_c0_seq1.p1  ORF type:complete len:320 (+),score=60.15 gnl/TRDRNA2_/TRDRNA2_48545_c0_seq1:100-1059(+)
MFSSTCGMLSFYQISCLLLLVGPAVAEADAACDTRGQACSATDLDEIALLQMKLAAGDIKAGKAAAMETGATSAEPKPQVRKESLLEASMAVQEEASTKWHRHRHHHLKRRLQELMQQLAEANAAVEAATLDNEGFRVATPMVPIDRATFHAWAYKKDNADCHDLGDVDWGDDIGSINFGSEREKITFTDGAQVILMPVPAEKVEQVHGDLGSSSYVKLGKLIKQGYQLMVDAAGFEALDGDPARDEDPSKRDDTRDGDATVDPYKEDHTRDQSDAEKAKAEIRGNVLHEAMEREPGIDATKLAGPFDPSKAQVGDPRM